jgi:hypothetical protein
MKVPAPKRLKQKYSKPLSNFAFDFNLRRFEKGTHVYYGRAAQVEPMKPTLKAPGCKRLKL